MRIKQLLPLGRFLLCKILKILWKLLSNVLKPSEKIKQISLKRLIFLIKKKVKNSSSLEKKQQYVLFRVQSSNYLLSQPIFKKAFLTSSFLHAEADLGKTSLLFILADGPLLGVGEMETSQSVLILS